MPGDMQVDDLALIERALKENKLFQYRPYGHPDTLDRTWLEAHGFNVDWSGKPWQLDFHNAGRDNPERMLMAANRVGKTEAGANEVAIHLTGRYPDWWRGKTFNKGIRAWCGSPTNLTSVPRRIPEAGLPRSTRGSAALTGGNRRDCGAIGGDAASGVFKDDLFRSPRIRGYITCRAGRSSEPGI